MKAIATLVSIVSYFFMLFCIFAAGATLHLYWILLMFATWKATAWLATKGWALDLYRKFPDEEI